LQSQILYLFAIAALLAMSPGGGADQANFPDIYIDGASAGDGSLASPLTDFASINWTTGGDNSVYDAVAANKDVTINLKKGVTWREQLTVGTSGSAAHPITIQAYGSGADPIINGADVVETWTEVPSISYDATSSHYQDESGTNSWSHTIGSGSNRLLVVCIAHENWTSDTVSGVTYDDVALTKAISKQEGANYAEIWYLLETDLPSTGAYTVVVTFPNAFIDSVCGAVSVDNVTQQAPEATASGSDTNTDTISTNITTISKNAWLFDVLSVSDDTTSTPGSGQVERFDVHSGDTGGVTGVASTKEVESTGLTSMSQTAAASQGRLAHCIVAFEALGGSDNKWQATLDTEAFQVFFDGITGNTQTAAKDVDSENDWFWEGNVLYVYSTTDPDGAYDDPGIEASVRDNGIKVYGKNYITIESIEGIYAHRANFEIVTSSATPISNFIIDNVTSTYAGLWGIRLSPYHETISDVVIKNSTIKHWETEGANSYAGIDIGGSESVSDITVQNNEIQHSISFQHDTNDNNNGITITPSTAASTLIIEDNEIWNVDHGISFGTSCSGWIIRRNYIHDTGDDGIYIRGDDASAKTYHNLLSNIGDNGIDIITTGITSAGSFYNNVVYNSLNYSIKYLDNTGRSATFKNNVFILTASATTLFICANSGHGNSTFDNNCYYDTSGTYGGESGGFASTDGGFNAVTFSTWQTTHSHDVSGLNIDPLMTDPGSDDFTLQVGSPCINRGTFVGLILDYLGLPVPIGHRPDIGAYEHKNGGAVIH